MPSTYLKPVKMCYLHQAAADLIAGLPAMSHETRFALAYPDVSERFWRENAQARQKAAKTRARGLSKNRENPKNLPAEDV